MNKSVWILIGVLVILVILITVIGNYIPLYLTIFHIILLVSGIIIGWFGKYQYDNYNKKPLNSNDFFTDEEEL